jgi:hypothetical protein
MSETARADWIRRVLGVTLGGGEARTSGKSTGLGCLFAGTADSAPQRGNDALSRQVQSLVNAARSGAAFCEECAEGAL